MFRYNFQDFPTAPGAETSATSSVPAAPAFTTTAEKKSFGDRCERLRENAITGVVSTPFHKTRPIPIVYTDFTASGRGLKTIEDQITATVLPTYGNTHTLTTATSRQTTFFRTEARNIVRHALNCCPINDAVIFCGSGSTAAANKFAKIVESQIRREHDNFWEACRTSGSSARKKGSGSKKLTDNIRQFFKEDRWGSCECSLCNVRLKNEACFRAHLQTTMHVENEKKIGVGEDSTTVEEGCDVLLAREAGTEDDASAVVEKVVTTATPSRRKTIFFLDPFAHHSSSLPFRELAARYPDFCECVECNEALDVDAFETILLEKVASYRRVDNSTSTATSAPPELYAILCAGSNVTGKLRDVAFLTQKLHKQNCRAVWDFAAAGAHCKIDVNPKNVHDAGIDAAFFSPHKLLGGPGCSGLLVAKKDLLQENVVPTVPGGGVVFYVSDKGHSYIQNHEEREEAGTPNILADIKTGMVYKIHRDMYDRMEAREQELREKFLQNMQSVENFCLLGGKDNAVFIHAANSNSSANAVSSDSSSSSTSAPIFSFLIQHEERYLHYNFVCAVLNDVFGIQARGGCACAGPYAQKLLGMSEAVSDSFELALQKYGCEVIRPGFCRLSLHYTMTDRELEFVVKALKWCCTHACELLPLYTFDVETGEWLHEDDDHQAKRNWLESMDLFSGRGEGTLGKSVALAGASAAQGEKIMDKNYSIEASSAAPVEPPPSRLRTFEDFEVQLLSKIRIPAKNRRWPVLDERVAELLWFSLPQDMVPEDMEHGRRNAGQAKNIFDRTRPPGDHGKNKAAGGLVERPSRSCFQIPTTLISSSSTGANKASSLSEKAGSHELQNLDEDSSTASTPSTRDSSSDGAGATLMSSPNKESRARATEAEDDTTFLDLSDIMGAMTFGGEDDESEGNYTTDQNPNKATSAPTQPSSSSHHQASAATAFWTESNGKLVQKYAATALYPKVPKTLRGLVGQAMKDFEMVQPHDRLLLGLSGGKDSLTLLHVLLHLQKCSPIPFQIACATVNPETPEYDPSPLRDYLKALNVEYHVLSKPLIELAKVAMNPKKPSICSFCARMKRGMLYTCMREHGYNVLVLGQHLDDLAESFLMSCFHNGALRTMKANYAIQNQEAGAIRVIRPLVYVREKVMAQFAEENKLPIIADNCPACFAVPKERHRVKLLLAKEEFVLHDLFSNLLKSMRPLIAVKHARIDDDEFVVRGEQGFLCDKMKNNGEDVGSRRPNSYDGDKVDRDTKNERQGQKLESSTRMVEGRITAADEDAAAEEALTKCGVDGGACARSLPCARGALVDETDGLEKN
ncbi:unnamed protein product [Amoebophrya sp. A120]|nr:unnamed protein product [Amoebophrya sp. A120]|eukprot:GSA120T00001563001.1